MLYLLLYCNFSLFRTRTRRISRHFRQWRFDFCIVCAFALLRYPSIAPLRTVSDFEMICLLTYWLIGRPYILQLGCVLLKIGQPCTTFQIDQLRKSFSNVNKTKTTNCFISFWLIQSGYLIYAAKLAVLSQFAILLYIRKHLKLTVFG